MYKGLSNKPDSLFYFRFAVGGEGLAKKCHENTRKRDTNQQTEPDLPKSVTKNAKSVTLIVKPAIMRLLVEI